MASLSDRLDYVVGAKAASPLDEVFGIRTVDDLLRHYPRSYVEGATVRGADDEQPPEGEHITLVDEITDTALLSIKSRPKDKLFRVTLGSGRGKVTATFFHPKKWITGPADQGHPRHAVRGSGILSRRHATDPPRLPGAGLSGRKESRQPVAEDDRRRLAGGERGSAAAGVRAHLLPDLSGQHEVAELGHLQLRSAGARRARSGTGSAARETLCRTSAGLRRRGAARYPPGRERRRPAASP